MDRSIALVPWLGAALLALTARNDGLYTFLVREDSILEWLQVLAYLAAAGLAFAVARVATGPARLVYGLLVVGALLSVGEELSWGQRLLSLEGFEAVTRANNQGELNVHNLRQVGRDSQVALLAAGVCGAVLPFLVSRGSRAALVFPARALTPAFALVAAYNAARLALGDAASSEQAKFSEWPELCFAACLALTAWFALRLLRGDAGRVGSTQGRRRELTHALGEGNLGVEAELRGGALGRGEDVTDVPESVLRRRHRLRAAERVGQLAGELADGARGAAGDVEGSGLPGTERENIRRRDVTDVNEIAQLGAVLEDTRGATALQSAPEDARDAGVGRVARHPRAVDVVVAKRRNGRARFARESGAERLLLRLRRRIDVARVERCVLGHGLGREREAADRAGRLELARVEPFAGARPGTDEAVLGAPVAALAVDDHAAREHERDRAPRELAEKRRRAEVVVADVVGDVAEVGPETDHRRLMAHRVGAGETACDELPVPHVAEDILGCWVEIVRPAGVGEGMQEVEDANGRTARNQLVDDVRADEAAAAGDENGVHESRSSAIACTGARAKARLVPGALLVAVALAGCGGSGGGSNALGGGAEVETLAGFTLARVAAGPLAWVTDEYRLAAGAIVEHAHESAFVYARGGASLLGGKSLDEGAGAAVAGQTSHRHAAPQDASSVVWETRLAAPGAPPPPGGRRVFAGPRLRGIPAAPAASFLLVRISPGGETSVHTHPGPELIYQLSGRILYQNALIGTVPLGPGGVEGIPPSTAVQKRNRSDADAVFLSWFLVDPDEPFAPAASFAG